MRCYANWKLTYNVVVPQFDDRFTVRLIPTKQLAFSGDGLLSARELGSRTAQGYQRYNEEDCKREHLLNDIVCVTGL